MIYIVIGVSPDKSIGLLSSGTNLHYAITAYDGTYPNYNKMIMFVINVHNQTLTLIAQR